MLLESGQLGHSVYIASYMTELNKMIDEKVTSELGKYFHLLVDLSWEFCRLNGQFPCAGQPAFLVNHMIRIIECYLQPYKPKFTDDEEEINIPGDIKDKLLNALIYAAIWGIGGALDETTRCKYDAFLKDLINGEDVVIKYNIDMGPDAFEKYPATKFPNKLGGDVGCLFDVYFD